VKPLQVIRLEKTPACAVRHGAFAVPRLLSPIGGEWFRFCGCLPYLSGVFATRNQRTAGGEGGRGEAPHEHGHGAPLGNHGEII
jgi:hypothetical protein